MKPWYIVCPIEYRTWCVNIAGCVFLLTVTFDCAVLLLLHFLAQLIVVWCMKRYMLCNFFRSLWFTACQTVKKKEIPVSMEADICAWQLMFHHVGWHVYPTVPPQVLTRQVQVLSNVCLNIGHFCIWLCYVVSVYCFGTVPSFKVKTEPQCKICNGCPSTYHVLLYYWFLGPGSNCYFFTLGV